jgi:multisubunit Na+/H+ antiporter MnhE subunit
MDRPSRLDVIAGGAVTVVVLTGVWIALAGRLDAQDLVGGASAAGLAAVVGFFVSQKGRALPSLRRRDARLIATFPWQVVVETAQVFGLAARKLTGKAVAGGSWAHTPVDVGGGGWRSARRDSVVTALLSVAPGTVVVDIDADSGVALVHRLGERSRAGQR